MADNPPMIAKSSNYLYGPVLRHFASMQLLPTSQSLNICTYAINKQFGLPQFFQRHCPFV
jgi:hypothetical protein